MVQAYALARQLSVRQHVNRAMAATEEVMHELLGVLMLCVACDLLHAAIFTLAYMVALRVSDVHARDESGNQLISTQWARYPDRGPARFPWISGVTENTRRTIATSCVS